MDKFTFDELEEKAAKIIWQDWHTKEDAKLLSQIKFFMAREYRKRNKDGGIEEARYNSLRSSKTAEFSDKMSSTKAGDLWKAEAEKKYGKYREIQSDSSGMSVLIRAIEWMIIGIQVELKWTDTVQF